MTSPDDDLTLADEGEFVPDYSRLGFRKLQALCKERGILADGTGPQLIEKLKAADARAGHDVDQVPDEIDLLDDEPVPDQPPAAGEGMAAASGASTPAAARPSATDDLAGPAVDVAPEVGTTPAAPAIRVVAAEGETGGIPAATLPGKGARPNLTARVGPVKVGEAHGAAEVRAFRWEYLIGDYELTDNDHFRYIAETHAHAQAAGHVTKGGITTGERVGYAADADGRRTAIYQVALKRAR